MVDAGSIPARGTAAPASVRWALERTMSESPTLYRVTLYRGDAASQWVFDADEFERAHALYEALDIEGDGRSVAWEVQY
jgi:hypothetical protein